MTIEIKHPFVSAKADSLDSTKVQPSNWNEGHDIEMGPNAVIGRGAGSGQAPAEELPAGAVGRASLAATTQAEGRAAIDAAASTSATTTTTVGAAIHAAAAKVTPVDADTMPLIDSAALNVMKKVTWANIKATLKTYFDTVYASIAVLAEAVWEAGTSTTEAIISPAKLKAAAVASGGGKPVAVLEHHTASGVSAGATANTTWNVRPLNDEYDPDGIITLAGNQFIASVDCWVEWSSKACESHKHQSRLYNVTDAVSAAPGTTGNASDSVSLHDISVGGAPIVAGKQYRLEHFTQQGDASGLGRDALGSGEENVWARVLFWRA
jgi:hypothetical protein